jgi:hypothetical protein
MNSKPPIDSILISCYYINNKSSFLFNADLVTFVKGLRVLCSEAFFYLKGVTYYADQ